MPHSVGLKIARRRSK